MVLYVVGLFIYIVCFMMEVCLCSCIYYLDIIGEILVFEMGVVLGEKVVRVEIMMMLGIGFDVVFIDCMVVFFKE